MRTANFLFVASNYKPEPGGIAEYIDSLARGLIRLGNRTRVLAIIQSHQNEKEVLAFLEKYEEWVIPFQVVHDKRPENWLGNRIVSLLEILRCVSPKGRRVLETAPMFRSLSDSDARLEEVFAREKPTMVIFGHLDWRLYSLALCLRDLGVPYCILCHGLDFVFFPNKKNDLIKKKSMLTGAKWIVANSNYTKGWLEGWGIPSGKIKVVYPPVAEGAVMRSDNLVGLHKKAGELNLLTLCRLVTGKAVDVVLRALVILAQRGISYRYVIGGDGNERIALEKLADELGLGSRVHFVGYCTGEEKWCLLRNSDVFVLPSRVESTWVESFGIAFMEAAAFGLAAVGSRVGGIPESIIDGETGILVPQESPEDLAEALTFLYLNPQKRAEMGRAGMERARREFSPTAIAAHFREEISKNI